MQTDSGIIFHSINFEKIAQPMQKPKIDSSDDATIIIETKTLAAKTESPIVAAKIALVVIRAPMPCANLFGGPGQNCGLTFLAKRGAKTLVTNCPSGLKVGPVNTRAQKP